MRNWSPVTDANNTVAEHTGQHSRDFAATLQHGQEERGKVTLTAKEYEWAALRNTIAPVLPYVEEELRTLEESRLRSAFAGLNAGTLTPEAALFTLLELKSYRDLARRLRQRAQLDPEVIHE